MILRLIFLLSCGQVFQKWEDLVPTIPFHVFFDFDQVMKVTFMILFDVQVTGWAITHFTWTTQLVVILLNRFIVQGCFFLD